MYASTAWFVSTGEFSAEAHNVTISEELDDSTEDTDSDVEEMTNNDTVRLAIIVI